MVIMYMNVLYTYWSIGRSKLKLIGLEILAFFVVTELLLVVDLQTSAKMGLLHNFTEFTFKSATDHNNKA